MDDRNARDIKWIVSPRYDLVFFIGSVSVSIAFLVAHYAIAYYTLLDGLTSWFLLRMIFSSGLDKPHIFLTASRVYADKEQYGRIRYLALFGLPFFALLWPALSYLGYGLIAQFVFEVVGSFHIVRQNVGFIKAYRRINGERDFERFDLGLYYVVMFGCIFRDHIGLRWHRDLGLARSDFVHGSELLPHTWQPVVTYVVIAAAALWIGRALYLFARGRFINWPKLLLMSATAGLHYLLIFTLRPRGMITVVETAYHDVQYMGWLARFQKLRFPNVAFVRPKWLLGAFAFSGLGYALVQADTAEQHYFNDFLIGIVMFHYVVDGFIWRFREDKALTQLFFAEHASPASAVDFISEHANVHARTAAEG